MEQHSDRCREWKPWINPPAHLQSQAACWRAAFAAALLPAHWWPLGDIFFFEPLLFFLSLHLSPSQQQAAFYLFLTLQKSYEVSFSFEKVALYSFRNLLFWYFLSCLCAPENSNWQLPHIVEVQQEQASETHFLACTFLWYNLWDAVCSTFFRRCQQGMVASQPEMSVSPSPPFNVPTNEKFHKACTVFWLMFNKKSLGGGSTFHFGALSSCNLTMQECATASCRNSDPSFNLTFFTFILILLPGNIYTEQHNPLH